ncbi:MAG: hypothetical protein R3F19_01085 [Verrucomicrobiales bacterium]
MTIGVIVGIWVGGKGAAVAGAWSTVDQETGYPVLRRLDVDRIGGEQPEAGASAICSGGICCSSSPISVRTAIRSPLFNWRD